MKYPKKDWKDELQEGEYLINALLNKNPLVDCTPAHKGVEFFNDKNKAIRTIKVLKLHLEMLRFAELRNGDWKPDWKNDRELKYTIEIFCDDIVKRIYECRYKALAFKTEELRDKFLENFRDLIKIAKPLL